MSRRTVITAVLAPLTALGVAIPTAAAALAAAPAPAASCAPVRLGLPKLVVLRQSDELRKVRAGTSCALGLLSATVYDGRNKSVDFLSWSQDKVVNGTPTNWTVYDFDYTAGHTYHTDDAAAYTYTGFDSVPVTRSTFVVKNATSAPLSPVARSGTKVTLTGQTRQYNPNADYGSGALVGHRQRVQIQFKRGTAWVRLTALTSTANGTVKYAYRTAQHRAYRLAILPSASSVGSASRVRLG